MSEKGLAAAVAKMEAGGVSPIAIKVFEHYYHELEAGASGLIPEETIEPLTQVDRLADSDISDEQAREAFSKTALIKLNGGLGTSMGLDRAKSLLPVRDGKTFLDIMCEQVRVAREKWDVRLPLIFMDSFRTRTDTLKALEKHPDIKNPDLPSDFIQHREPKLRADNLEPVDWPDDPSLEWCPPGHGDIYTALLASGILEKLLDQGFRYAMTSNSDNLGAYPSPHIAGWFAASGAPYAAELCTRTAADRKGGHLAIRKSDGQLILRDTAQTPPDQMHYFTDEHRHPFFHTNNLWFDLEVLMRTLQERDAVLGLPLITNHKTVDPTDKSSTPVIQLESAMGAAVQVFPGATAIVVPRERFLPVKTTNDLALVRSDVYHMNEDAHLVMNREVAPLVQLAEGPYKTISNFDERFQNGVPSLANAEAFKVDGDWSFGGDVTVQGYGHLGEEGGVVPAGALITEAGIASA